MNRYDEVLYNNCAILHSHPNRLAVMASLLGLEPAPVERCRVLELGCGDGTNLIPMAHALPESRFLGVDLAGLPVAKGRDMIKELGLHNIALERMDILDFPKDAGKFDYIIAHGIYSWVPEPVRDKILEITGAHLASHGVAYVSYNTYPGWRIRQMMREMMQYHTAECSDALQKIRQARALAEFLASSADKETIVGRMLADEMGEVLARPGPGLYHDDLSPINVPVYFAQFASHAAKHGLQFLAETQFALGQEFHASGDMVESLQRISTDTIQREQYLDFVECRRFRQTLLCRDSIPVNRDLNLEILESLMYVSLGRLEPPELELNSSKAVKFAGSRRASLWTANPTAKAALQHLGENWPMPCTAEEIRSAAAERISRAGVSPDVTLNDGQEKLLELLLTAYGAGLVEALPKSPKFVVQVSERPVSSPIARLQLVQGNVVTSLLHTTFDVSDPLARQLILLMDGTRDRAAILQGLAPLIESGTVTLKRDNQPVTDRAGAMQLLVAQLEDALKNVARVPLLVA